MILHILMMKDVNEYHDEIEKLWLPELECRILELVKEIERSRTLKCYQKLVDCLQQRKYLMNRNFKFTPEIVNQIARMNRILVDNRAKLYKLGQWHFRQMLQLKAQGDEFLTDFDVEGAINVVFTGQESLCRLDFDENNGLSNYLAMAEVLQWTEAPFDRVSGFSFTYMEDENLEASDEELDIVDTMLEHNWNMDLLDAPELIHIGYIGYALYNLFVHSKRAISDIIRIKDFENNVTVTRRNHLGVPELVQADFHEESIKMTKKISVNLEKHNQRSFWKGKALVVTKINFHCGFEFNLKEFGVGIRLLKPMHRQFPTKNFWFGIIIRIFWFRLLLKIIEKRPNKENLRHFEQMEYEKEYASFYHKKLIEFKNTNRSLIVFWNWYEFGLVLYGWRGSENNVHVSLKVLWASISFY